MTPTGGGPGHGRAVEVLSLREHEYRIGGSDCRRLRQGGEVCLPGLWEDQLPIPGTGIGSVILRIVEIASGFQSRDEPDNRLGEPINVNPWSIPNAVLIDCDVNHVAYCPWVRHTIMALLIGKDDESVVLRDDR